MGRFEIIMITEQDFSDYVDIRLEKGYMDSQALSLIISKQDYLSINVGEMYYNDFLMFEFSRYASVGRTVALRYVGGKCKVSNGGN